MAGMVFDRPVGPFADTKELEYIAALHQTTKEIRRDGSIRAEDIQAYLSSRHGIVAEEEVIRLSIIEQLGGSLPIIEKDEDEEAFEPEPDLDDEEQGGKEEEEDGDEEPEQSVLDICQITAMLLIPFFRKGNMHEDVLINTQTLKNASEKDADGKESFDHYRTIVGCVLDVALRNILGELQEADRGADAENHGVLMTPQVLRKILDSFGEYDAPDSLLEEMIELAQTDQNSMNQSELFFNKSAFLQGLTGDTQVYNPELIDLSDTTHFDDARCARENQQLALYGNPKQLRRRRGSVQPAPEMKDPEGKAQALPFEHIYQANNIDQTADNYRSASWSTIVTVETVLIWLCYMQGTAVNAGSWIPASCEERSEGAEFGCKIARSLVGFTVGFSQLMILGFTWNFMATLGNSTDATPLLKDKLWLAVRIMAGMGMVLFCTIIAYFKDHTYAIPVPITNETRIELFDTATADRNPLYDPAYWTCMLGGFAILYFQLIRITGLFLPLGPLAAGGMEKKERRTKEAASHKVLNLVEHAMLLHQPPASDLQNMERSTVSKSVLDFTSSLHKNSKKSTTHSNANRAADVGPTTNRAMLNFHRIQDTREETGGVVWFLKGAWNGTLFSQEGVFLHGRLIATNMLHFFIASIIMMAFYFAFEILNEYAGDDDGCTVTLTHDKGLTYKDSGIEIPSVDPDWNLTENGYENLFNINETHWVDPFWGFAYEGQLPKYNEDIQEFDLGERVKEATFCYLDATGTLWVVNATSIDLNFRGSINLVVKKQFLIEPYMWKAALALGLLAGFGAVMSIGVFYIPSFTSSVLKLRSGVTPSLKAIHDEFGALRSSPDATAYIFGINFWGCFYTTITVTVLSAAVVFVLFWPMAHPYLKAVFAGVLGVAVVVVVKTIILKVLRGKFYKSFYRLRPAGSNIMNVVLESYALGTSVAVVSGRFIKLIVVSALYIGRIDSPMLAPGVLALDSAPKTFTVDLLLHEAHRHPYIERLGLLYLLKLYNGKDFGTRAGAYWRMLFVLALCPWMRNYRIRPKDGYERPEEEDEDMMSVRMQVQQEMSNLENRSTADDIFGVQLEMDLTRRAYNRSAHQNKMLKAALIAARDKVRELREEKRQYKRQVKELKKRLEQAGKGSGDDGYVSESSRDHNHPGDVPYYVGDPNHPGNVPDYVGVGQGSI